MSDFSCDVVKVEIKPHPNADAIEIAQVGDYQSIVKKGQFVDGELGVYIPEQSLLPDDLLRLMGFWDELNQKGTLSGWHGNRVKAIKLRGVLSQGILLKPDYDENGDPYVASIYGINTAIKEGMDVADLLGIQKYVPVVPAHFGGRVFVPKTKGNFLDYTVNYDFENIKKHPTLFEEGEEVVFTEKIHGTFMMVGVMPERMTADGLYRGCVAISSKGLAKNGFLLDCNDMNNIYVKTAYKLDLFEKMHDHFGNWADIYDTPFFLLLEVFGPGVQDLTYTKEVTARAFDLLAGTREYVNYSPFSQMQEICKNIEIETVPLLYSGPYSKEIMLQHTNGKTTLDADHIREGIVIKSASEELHPKYGRKIAKSISEKYLLRKNGSEFN
jgi:RNA ligase (TIGR02306 family)